MSICALMGFLLAQFIFIYCTFSKLKMSSKKLNRKRPTISLATSNLHVQRSAIVQNKKSYFLKFELGKLCKIGRQHR